MIVRDVSNEFDIDRVKDIPWKKEVSDKKACTPLLSLMLFSLVQKQAHCANYVFLSQNLSCQFTYPNICKCRDGAAEHFGCMYLTIHSGMTLVGFPDDRRFTYQ